MVKYFIISYLFIQILSTNVAAQSVKIDSVFSLAVRTQKLIFIDFYTTWCGPCREMDRTTFQNEEVKALLNSNFHFIKLNAEKEGIQLAKHFNVTAYPTFIVCDAEMVSLRQLLGYKTSDNFIPFLKSTLLYYDAVKNQSSSLNKEKLRKFLLLNENNGQFYWNKLDDYIAVLKAQTTITANEVIEVAKFSANSQAKYTIESAVYQFLKTNFQLENVANSVEVGSTLTNILGQTASKIEKERGEDLWKKLSLEYTFFREKVNPNFFWKSQFLYKPTLKVFAENKLLLNEQLTLFEKELGIDSTADKSSKAYMLNDMAWGIYRNKLADFYKNGVRFAEQSYKYVASSSSLQTQAHLLYVMGNYEQAIELQRNSIELAKKMNEPHDVADMILQNMIKKEL